MLIDGSMFDIVDQKSPTAFLRGAENLPRCLPTGRGALVNFLYMGCSSDPEKIRSQELTYSRALA
jgi:hypothetical protein